MAEYEDERELESLVEEDRLVIATLGDLREMLNYKKLGSRVLEEIAASLRARGLGYFPQAVLDYNPAPRQGDAIRIYGKGSAVGKLIDAVLEPSEKNDTYLLEASSAEDAQAAQILDQIRTLVGSR